MFLALCSLLILASICFLVLIGSGFFLSFSSSFVSALISPFFYSFRGVCCLIINLIWDGIRFLRVVFCLVSFLICSFWNSNCFAAASGLPRCSSLNATVRFSCAFLTSAFMSIPMMMLSPLSIHFPTSVMRSLSNMSIGFGSLI